MIHTLSRSPCAGAQGASTSARSCEPLFKGDVFLNLRSKGENREGTQVQPKKMNKFVIGYKLYESK